MPGEPQKLQGSYTKRCTPKSREFPSLGFWCRAPGVGVRVAQGCTLAAMAEHMVLKTTINSTWGLVWLHKVAGQRKVMAYGLLASAGGRGGNIRKQNRSYRDIQGKPCGR